MRMPMNELDFELGISSVFYIHVWTFITLTDDNFVTEDLKHLSTIITHIYVLFYLHVLQ